MDLDADTCLAPGATTVWVDADYLVKRRPPADPEPDSSNSSPVPPNGTWIGQLTVIAGNNGNVSLILGDQILDVSRDAEGFGSDGDSLTLDQTIDAHSFVSQAQPLTIEIHTINGTIVWIQAQ